MPKNFKVIEMEGESQSNLIFRCKKDGVIRQILNKRAYTTWIRLHKKKCDCLREGFKPTDGHLAKTRALSTGQIRSESESYFK